MQEKAVKREYDRAMKSKAYTGLVLRIAVAGYLCYMAYMVLSGMLHGGSPVPVWAVWVICAIFAGVAVIFCVYAWISFRKALKSAELPSVPETETVPNRGAADSEEHSS